jgi:hypothetical protein
MIRLYSAVIPPLDHWWTTKEMVNCGAMGWRKDFGTNEKQGKGMKRKTKLFLGCRARRVDAHKRFHGEVGDALDGWVDSWWGATIGVGSVHMHLVAEVVQNVVRRGIIQSYHMVLDNSPSGCGSASSPAVYTPPVPYLNPPPESRRQSIKTTQTLIRASRLIQSHPSVTLPTPITHNAPLHAFCQRIPVMVASVAEAEYAAAFGGGQVLGELTLTLTNLGHPQQ